MVEGPATPMTERVGFDQLGLSSAMLHSVAEMGFELPTPIQAEAIPYAVQGRDVIGQAQTGSGKTAAFAIPILERLNPDDGPAQALILCPTRELVVQVQAEIARLATGHRISVAAVYGGDSITRQAHSLRTANVVVATPGRLGDQLQRRSLRLDNVRIAVLDEADRMLDMGFAPDVERILRQCPEGRQTLLFSATMPDWVRRLAARYMRDAVNVDMNTRPEIPAGVRQLYLQTSWADKTDALTRILDQPDVSVALIFVETKRTADMLEAQLQRRSLRLDNVRIAVLDEADRMLDMGFAPDVERILRQCPEGRQTLLFSATMPDWVRRLAARYMRDAVNVDMNTRPEIPAGVRQLYLQTSWADKTDALTRILDQPDVSVALIFVETKRTADMLEAQLQRRGYRVGLLHGDLTQRDRDRAMRHFRESHTKYLIATNLAARGLDVDDISHVINYDVPVTPDEYVHRVGRTARAGRSGVAITLITPSEILKLRDVERHARTTIEPATIADFPIQPLVAQA